MSQETNEFGETISEDAVKGFVTRIRELSDEQIDDLWFRCGFVYSEREEKFKALNQECLDKIRESPESAALVFGWMWSETKTETISENLIAIEDA